MLPTINNDMSKTDVLEIDVMNIKLYIQISLQTIVRNADENEILISINIGYSSYQ